MKIWGFFQDIVEYYTLGIRIIGGSSKDNFSHIIRQFMKMLLDKFSDPIFSSAVLTRPTMGEGENGMKLKSFTAHVSKRWFDNQISISILHQIAQVHHISWTQLKHIDIWKHLNSRHVIIGNFFALPFSWEVR